MPEFSMVALARSLCFGPPRPIVCKHCGEPIGHITDDPAYRELGGYTHHPEDGPDSYIGCGDEYGTQAEPKHELPR